ncbi:protein N-lysine methyltransferase METTL21A-like [Branchiostoma floridae x Branchiostoma japonicum]
MAAALSSSKLVMCCYLYARHDVLRGVASVLELGSGTGLVGILASRISRIPGRVVLTDHDTRVKRLLNMNIAENFTNLADRPRCAHLKWGEGLDQFEVTYGTFDLILGSDLLYTRCACVPLFQTVGKLLHKKVPKIIADISNLSPINAGAAQTLK